MESKGVTNKKISGKTLLILLIVLAVPGFFWFRFLYDQFVVDKTSPEMQKMQDAMMQPHPPPAKTPAAKHNDAKKPAKGPSEKGENKTTPHKDVPNTGSAEVSPSVDKKKADGE